jgi:hypothetical protein
VAGGGWGVRAVSDRTDRETERQTARSSGAPILLLPTQVGQYYVAHHDFIPGHSDMPCGPRLYTFFLYLIEVDQGGATKFNRLGFQVSWGLLVAAVGISREPLATPPPSPPKKSLKWETSAVSLRTHYRTEFPGMFYLEIDH